ncbi:hypothetical protein [Streptomyces xylophagus]|uniref:hypothetical protein n=1 Tax=Streptomyces xylophagus TaxID=285514 RepID=UPI0005BCEA18|nr:hypothetical protein [Streptomyces xylophagus]
MERPKVDANIATGLDLDQWALHVGTMPRRPGETDDVGVEESVTYVARPSAKHRFTERELAALYEIEDMPRPEGPEWK